MRKLTTAVLSLVLVAGASSLSAQNANANASVTVPTVLAITVDNLNIAFGSASGADFTAGYINAATTSTVDTRGNVVHDVTIQADAANFTYTGSETPAPTKAASDLEWTNDGGTSYTAIDNVSAADVATALARGVHAGAVTVGYRIALDLAADAPGDYALNFTYTVVAN